MPKDHYVSQTYLSNFSNEDGFLIPYYKGGFSTVGKRKSTSSVCFEIDGDVNNQFSDPRIVDGYLKLFENNWTSHVTALKNMDGSLDTKYGIAGYISFLQRCTPTAKRLAQNYLTHSIQPLAERIIKRGINDPKLDPDIRDTFRSHQDKKLIDVTVTREHVHAMAITKLVDTTNHLFCSNWLVLFNNTEIPFITSDNPVVLYYGDNHNNQAKTFIPLSPKIGVLITPYPSDTPPTKKDMEEFDHNNDLNRDIKEEYVHVFNELIVRSAENIVLHSKQEEWIIKLVEKNNTWRMESIITELNFDDSVITKYSLQAVDTKAKK